jgi:pimeloyl-ACP methyl ester carboxylesterase
MTDLQSTSPEVKHSAGHMELRPGVPVFVRIHEPANFTKTVLCMHGAVGSSADFDELAKALAADGWRVLAYDRPGIGRSPLPDSILKNFVLANLGILQAFMKAPGGVDAVVCSSGGAAMFHTFWARLAPKLELKTPLLVYSEPGFEMSDEVKASIQSRAAFMAGRYATFEEARAAWLTCGWGQVAFANDEVRDEFLKNRLLHIDEHYRPAVNEKLLSSLRNSTPLKGVDALRVQANFQGPLLLMHTAEREAHHQGRLPTLKASYPDVRMHAVSGSGHPLSLTTQHEISTIRDFLNREVP